MVGRGGGGAGKEEDAKHRGWGVTRPPSETDRRLGAAGDRDDRGEARGGRTLRGCEGASRDGGRRRGAAPPHHASSCRPEEQRRGRQPIPLWRDRLCGPDCRKCHRCKPCDALHSIASGRRRRHVVRSYRYIWRTSCRRLRSLRALALRVGGRRPPPMGGADLARERRTPSQATSGWGVTPPSPPPLVATPCRVSASQALVRSPTPRSHRAASRAGHLPVCPSVFSLGVAPLLSARPAVPARCPPCPSPPRFPRMSRDTHGCRAGHAKHAARGVTGALLPAPSRRSSRFTTMVTGSWLLRVQQPLSAFLAARAWNGCLRQAVRAAATHRTRGTSLATTDAVRRQALRVL